jgi:hypothetical protein
MANNLSILGYLFPQNSGNSLISIATSRGQTTSSPSEAVAALKTAQKNETAEVARKANDTQVKREIDRFKQVLARAKTPEDVLNDRTARNVLLTANGLGASVDYGGLAKRALLGDYTAEGHAAQKLKDSQPSWLSTAQTYDFNGSGLDELRKPDAIKRIVDNFTQVRWQEDLESRAPGLSFAITFIKDAAKVDRAVEVLGNKVAREVITGAFNIPKQIAYQPLETQIEVIERKVDVSRLSDQKYREDIARRYLINKNQSSNDASGGILTLFA